MRQWLGPILATVLTAVGGVALSARAIDSMTPTFRGEQPPVVETPAPEHRKAAPPPAIAAVDGIMAALPKNMPGLRPAATAPSRPVGGCVTPVVSRTKAWSGGNWLRPSGVVVTASVVPAGMGYAAEQCAPGKVIRRGDIVVSVETTRASANIQTVIDAVDANTGQCADPTRTPDQSGRNPFSDKFVGYVTTVAVEFDGTTPRQAPAKEPRIVEVPDTPEFPHAPEALPAMPEPPQAVEGIAMPRLTRTFEARVPDPIGPGCGWKFTGTRAPITDDDALRRTIEQRSEQLQQDMATEVDAYNSRLPGYDQQAAAFDKLNPAWEQWADEVEVIARRWQHQADRWSVYQQQLAEYNTAKDDYDKFVADQQAAQTQYDQQMQQCMVPTPEPEPTVSPTTEPSATPTPEPEPSATPTPTPCPTRPPILDEQPPTVPEPPTPPRPR